jgi:hypothetical protein
MYLITIDAFVPIARYRYGYVEASVVGGVVVASDISRVFRCRCCDRVHTKRESIIGTKTVGPSKAGGCASKKGTRRVVGCASDIKTR